MTASVKVCTGVGCCYGKLYARGAQMAGFGNIITLRWEGLLVQGLPPFGSWRVILDLLEGTKSGECNWIKGLGGWILDLLDLFDHWQKKKCSVSKLGGPISHQKALEIKGFCSVFWIKSSYRNTT